jgi:RPA family protein
MKNILFVFLATFSIHCFSQDTITTAKVKDYMDKEVCVIGKVVSFKLAAEGKNTNYINIDKPYPESVFTVVISNYHLEKLNIKIEDLKDKNIYIKGKITTYKNDPKQIPQIFNPSSIEIKKD